MDITVGDDFLGLRDEKVSVSLGPVPNGYCAVGVLWTS
jgi:hypothetical protein